MGILQTKVLTDEEQDEEIRREALEKMKQDAEENEEEGGGGDKGGKTDEAVAKQKKEARRSVVKRSSKDKSQMEQEINALTEDDKRPGSADSKKDLVEKTPQEKQLDRYKESVEEMTDPNGLPPNIPEEAINAFCVTLYCMNEAIES